MKFRILLENRKNGEEAVIEMPANASLESISSKIKVAFRLPYADYAWRIEPFGLDEAWLDVTGHAMDGPAIADELRLRRLPSTLHTAGTRGVNLQRQCSATCPAMQCHSSGNAVPLIWQCSATHPAMQCH